jgi:hypothetical protein
MRWGEFGIGVGLVAAATVIVFGAWLWVVAVAHVARWLS